MVCGVQVPLALEEGRKQADPARTPRRRPPVMSTATGRSTPGLVQARGVDGVGVPRVAWAGKWGKQVRVMEGQC